MGSQVLNIVKKYPSNLEAEKAVIGAIMINNSLLPRVAGFISPNDFYDLRHKLLFQKMISMYEVPIEIDMLTLTEELNKSGILEKVGNITYIATLGDNVIATENVEYYGKIVKEKSLKRQLITVAESAVNKAYSDGDEAEDLIKNLESEISTLYQKNVPTPTSHVSEIAKEGLETLEHLYENQGVIDGTQTGFHGFDKKTTGLHPGDLIIVAARPSMGKTAFCLNVAGNLALRYQKTCLFFSLEMTKKQLFFRLIAAEARVPLHKIMEGKIKHSEMYELIQAANKFSKTNLYIDDQSGLNILSLKAKAKRVIAEVGSIDLIIIDYLQLMESASNNRNESIQQKVTNISRGLKLIAKDLKVPLIALSQLNRSVETRKEKSKRPILSDLRESGAIEQDADLVCFIYREEYYYKMKGEEPPPEVQGIAEIIIGKQRNGPTGIVKLAFLDTFTRFDNLALNNEDF